MKRIKLFVGLFVFSLLLFPGVKVKAETVVSDEASLRAAIEQGGKILLARSIKVTESLVIEKDVNLSGVNYRNYSITMQGDGTLLTVNNGNVNIGVYLDGQNALVVNGGTVNLNQGIYANEVGLELNGGTVNLDQDIYANKVGLELNGGTITGKSKIYAGEYNDNDTYSGGQAMVINGGDISKYELSLFSGGSALTINSGANINLNGLFYINSYEENGIEINDGAVLNIEGWIQGCENSFVFGSKNAIYLNGGMVNLSGPIQFSTSDTGYSVYMNKGVNTATNGNALVFKDDFVFSYRRDTTFSFNIYVNPNIDELRVADEKKFLVLKDNKLNVGYCIKSYAECVSQSEEDREAVCKNIGGNYNGTIESNELKSCTALYINGEKTVIDEENCKTEEPAQIVTVPSTFFSNMYYVVVGVVLVIIAVFIIYMIVSKKKVKNK